MRDGQAPFLFPITEKFKDQGIMGTIVSGKVEAGRIRKGKQVLLMPNRKLCEIIGIDGEAEEEVPAATCGDNVRIRLKGVEEDEIARGFVLCDAQRPVQVVQSFEAQLRILEHKNIFCAGYSCVLHVHTLVEEVEVVALLHLIKGKKRSKKPPAFATNGQIVVARLETRGPVCLETYNSNKQLGRFTLRDEGKTIAMGKIIRLSESEEETAAGGATAAE
jgi:peptide chain release factor subunit 3